MNRLHIWLNAPCSPIKIPAKPSTRLSVFQSIIASLALVLVTAPHAAAATHGPKLPVIQQVGVLPVQWEGDAPNKDAIEDAFSAAIRATHRFHVLGDDLIRSLWTEQSGRDELVTQFELHSYASLTVTPRSDTVVFTARLLDPNLKTQLQETDTVSRSWLTAAAPEAVGERLQKLVFRLINRIPVDVSVTSVQGSYITLSGGSEQGLQVGDNVDLVRSTITSLHPANGSWLEFHQQALGNAQIIEAKGYTSVARLINLTIDNAVEVGDGARIPAIASRQKFARQVDGDNLKDSKMQLPIIVPPIYLGTPQTAATSEPSASKPQATTPQATLPPPVYAQNDQTKSDVSPTPPPAAPASTHAEPDEDADKSEDPSIWDRVSNAFSGTADTVDAVGGAVGGAVGAVGGVVGAVVDRPFDDIRLYAGPSWWKISGKDPGLNSAGKFPLWLLNSLGGGITRATVYKFRIAFGGGGGFGKTPAGNWYGYNGYGGIYWEDSFGDDPSALLSTWRAGGQANLSGMAVERASDSQLSYFGGGDWVRGGLIGGLGGRLEAGGNKFDWFSDFALYPINIGRVGSQGKFELVESTFAYSTNIGAYQHEPGPLNMRWGGEFDYTDERLTLKSGKRAHLTNFAMKVLARYPLP